MVFWTAVLIGGLFVWLAVRVGFYEIWGLLFSSVLSIYVAIFLAPIVAGFATGEGSLSGYSTALGLIALAGGCFALLYGLSYVFLTGQFRISFPEILDILLAGGLGFLTGFLISSFATVVLTTTPLAEHKLAGELGLTPDAQQSNIACLAWCCDRVHAFVGGDTEGSATELAIGKLWKQSASPDSQPDAGPGDGSEPALSPDVDTSM